jgi:hypothetical protein
MVAPQNIKNRITIWSKILALGTYPKELKEGIQYIICVHENSKMKPINNCKNVEVEKEEQ